MDFKRFFRKIIPLILVLGGLFQIIHSSVFVFLVYPQINPSYDELGLLIEKALTEKAAFYFVSMILQNGYGATLIAKDEKDIKTYQLIIGAIIFILSLFLVTESPLTSNPLTEFLKNGSYPSR